MKICCLYEEEEGNFKIGFGLTSKEITDYQHMTLYLPYLMILKVGSLHCQNQCTCI